MNAIKTSIGELKLILHSGTAGTVSTVGTTARMFNVDYTGSLQIEFADGAWRPTRDEHGRDFNSVYLSRADHQWKRGISSAARDKFKEVTLAAAQAWLAEHPEAIRAAQHAHVGEEVERRQAKVRELTAEVERLEAEIAALQSKEVA